MQQRFAYATLLLATSVFVAPAALAQVAGGSTQSSPPAATTTGTTPDDVTPAQQAQGQDPSQDQAAEVSAPGFDASAVEDIVVVGRNIPNTIRATPQVVSVLSSADIARTGEGDIAGALARVSGLSVVGNGFVYVRGLGDRYSSALLNGSPLPSPEPLRRSVPLDIFPTTIIGSALVQKTYSVNYPGEFGGGVVNLTTKAIPEKSFVSIGGTVAADTATTSELGYTYAGGKHDWIGFDSGERKVPNFIKAAPHRAAASFPPRRSLNCPTHAPRCSRPTISCPRTCRRKRASASSRTSDRTGSALSVRRASATPSAHATRSSRHDFG